MNMANIAFKVITDKICDLISSGQLNWRKTWSIVPPRNYVSNKPYNGVNALILPHMGFSSPYWLTYKQAREQGGSVKKGEHGTPVIFAKPIREKEEEEDSSIRGVVFRYYTVFNLTQCEGVPEKTPPGVNIRPREEVKDLVAKINPEIRYGNPSYCPPVDVIFMPNQYEFESSDQYWGVLFHELTHWTGHKNRLAREEVLKIAKFGDESYSREELVAELGSAYLSAQYGLDVSDDQTAAYIQGWLKPLKDNPMMIVQAAARAQKAVEYILCEGNVN
jgi:antirestriction protein ArdC